jgi:hypothetical protein
LKNFVKDTHTKIHSPTDNTTTAARKKAYPRTTGIWTLTESELVLAGEPGDDVVMSLEVMVPVWSLVLLFCSLRVVTAPEDATVEVISVGSAPSLVFIEVEAGESEDDAGVMVISMLVVESVEVIWSLLIEIDAGEYNAGESEDVVLSVLVVGVIWLVITLLIEIDSVDDDRGFEHCFGTGVSKTPGSL